MTASSFFLNRDMPNNPFIFIWYLPQRHDSCRSGKHPAGWREAIRCSAHGQFALRMASVAIAVSRPVTMEIVYFAPALCFTSLQIFTGGRPMAAPTGAIIKPLCHSENGKIPKTSAENNRAGAKTTTAVFNADSSPAAAGIRQRKLRRISAVVSGIAVKPR